MCIIACTVYYKSVRVNLKMKEKLWYLYTARLAGGKLLMCAEHELDQKKGQVRIDREVLHEISPLFSGLFLSVMEIPDFSTGSIRK